MSSIDVKISQINSATSIIVLVLLCIAFAIGSIGLIFNVIVFTRPNLRREPCSLYFLSSTFFNLFFVFVIIPVRILSNSFNISMSNYNAELCKIEIFAFYSVRSISCWLIAMACIDRYLHSSANANIRRLSSLKTAKIIIASVIIIILILYSHMMVYLNIQETLNRFGTISYSCNFYNSTYRTFMSFWYMTFYSLFPSCLMILFGCFTMNNIRKRRQIVSVSNENNRIIRRTDNQLLRMLVAQALVIIITTLPQTIYQIYASFTMNLVKDTLRIAQENLANKTSGGMTYFCHSTSFYLFTLSGSIFRRELYKFISQCCHVNRTRVNIFRSEMNQMSTLTKNRRITGIKNTLVRQS
ncbi:unnamed protein product [Rotaria sordida]|uniref:G-protein coupled receptors family 1 profile domain-containing protein n=1 Tax=Rotaria sordida TaxID=392033 RepID=A0A814SRH7_9BILA|nr:unnamed protein product [Rotaria sordida]